MSGATRRKFLAGAAALPVVGIGVGEIPAAADAMASPPPIHPFKWWFGFTDEVFNEECETREEALRLLAQYGEGLIAECQRQNYDLSLEGDTIIEALYGQNEERIGDGEFLEDATAAQVDDLGKMVSETIELWARKHKIDTFAWSFGVVRNRVRFEELP